MSVFARKGKRLQAVLCFVLAMCLLLGQAPLAAVAVPAQEVCVTDVVSGAYRPASNDWYIILKVDNSDFALTSVAGLKATVDSATAQVWFQSNAAMGESSGKLIFTLETTKAEHTVTFPAGTVLGDYTLKEDFVFKTHADGTVDFEKPGTAVEFSFFRGQWQAENSRYLVWLDDDVTEALTIPWKPFDVLSVDGADKSVYAMVDSGKVMLVLDSFVGISKLGEHTITVKKGTKLGDYEIAKDVTFRTHADGTVDSDRPSTAVNFSFFRGVWQAQSNRYLVWLEDDATEALTIPWTPFDVLSVDGTAKSVYAMIDSGKVMLVLDGTVGITKQSEHTITLKKGTKLGNYEIAQDVTFYTHEDGTVDAAQPSTAVNFSFFRGQWQAENSRYLVWLEDDVTEALTIPWKAFDVLSVDGADKSVYAMVDSGKVMLVLDSFVGISKLGEHTITVKKGTMLGDYEIAQDVTFYTHEDGTVNSAQPSTAVNFSFFRGQWQGENSRYLVWLEDDVTETLTIPWKAFDVLSVDGADKSVYAMVDAGKVMLVLDGTVGITKQAEHTVTLKKGTKLGDYEIAQDVTFYTHEDGTVDAIQPSTAVNFSFFRGQWQAENSRYLVWLEDDVAQSLTIPWKPFDILTVDGADKGVYAVMDAGKVMLVLDSSVGISQLGEHTITLKKGTYLADYEIAQDVTFYTHKDGTVDMTPPSKPVNFTLDRGTWQFVPESGLARYLVWLEADVDGELSVPWVPLEGLTVNAQKAVAYAVVDSGKIMLILDQETGITQPGKYTVTLQQGTYIGKYQIAQDVTFYTDGLTVSAEPPAQIPQPSETVTVKNDSRNLNGDCTDGLYFQVSPEDALPYDEKSGSIGYSAATGGIYVNGQLTQVAIYKWLPNLYYVPLSTFGYLPQKGDVVAIDGVFGNGQHAVTYEKQSFVYDGEGNWEIGTYLRDLREQEYIVQDVSELKMGVSEFALKPGNETLIGEAKRGTNIAIRTIVSTGLGTDEFNFGFSKIDGMWDAQKSGWQAWLRPESNQVFLAHGTSEWQVTGYYEFTKEEFTVEFGTVNLDEYVNGENTGLYCRKIFLKIDGEEVLSYKDMNLSRNVGKKLFVYTSQDAADSKLISLTSKGVTLRELTPKIYDYYDLTGFAADTVPGGSTVCLGETATSSNVAVRMKMDLSTNATEVRLALSKQEKDNFWDAAGSGWQLWLRPKWDMLYIAHGENAYEVITGHSFRSSFTLEFGVRDVIVEKDGKYVGTYCRKVYVLIDGQEVAAWEDTDFGRRLGKCVMMLTSLDSEADVSTRKKTVTLPLQTVVNGETVESSDLLKLDPQVISGQDSKIALTYTSDAYHKTTYGGLYHNGEKLEPLEHSGGKVVYLLKDPAPTDQLKVELSVKELTADEPTAVFDLFDMSGKDRLEVPARTTVSVGAMVDRDGQAAVNSAVRFAIELADVFNGVQLTILADSSSPWSNSGAMLQITPNQIHFCYPAVVERMASFASDLFAPGSLVCMEFGIVKCYENGIYKYDRWYVKAGKTVEEMELIGWHDSAERGHYGAHFCCHGSDMEQSYYLHSLKNIYSLTDHSSEENKALLRTYQQLGNTLPELYYPKALAGYSTLEQTEQPGRINFYTKPGTKLSRFTVDGADVTEQVTVGADGAYSYTLPGVAGNVGFAYEIVQDDTRHTVTAGGDEKLQFTLPEDGVLTGDDLHFAVMAQKGYVPQVTANGAEVLLTVNEETGVWYGTVKSVRQNIELVGKAAERSYTLSVNTPNNATITLGGDADNGILPFGGRLEITVRPDSGSYIQAVRVNGAELPVDENGTAVLEAVYWDVESITVEAEMLQTDASAAQKSANGSLVYIWIGLGVLAAAAAAAAVILLRRKKGR